MNVERLAIEGMLLVRPPVYRDERGFLLESWSEARHRAAGIDCAFVQDNHSRSLHGVLRGLHFQAFGGTGELALPGQEKLVRVARGRIWDVAVDLRKGSPSFGRWCARELDDESHEQLFVPAGCAHGFVVLSEMADVVYKLSTPYDPAIERGIAWDDPDLAIRWPIATPIVSARDRTNPAFRTVVEAMA